MNNKAKKQFVCSQLAYWKGVPKVFCIIAPSDILNKTRGKGSQETVNRLLDFYRSTGLYFDIYLN